MTTATGRGTAPAGRAGRGDGAGGVAAVAASSARKHRKSCQRPCRSWPSAVPAWWPRPCPLSASAAVAGTASAAVTAVTTTSPRIVCVPITHPP